jgi:putative resolvase
MSEKNKYIGGKQASEKLGVHQRTLYNWEEKGIIETIRTPGGKRLYNIEKYLRENKINQESHIMEDLNEIETKNDRLFLSYVRVSSKSQENDLERQKKIINKNYPNHTMIEDIGSGVNFNRRGLKKIIDWAIEGRIEELVIAYKDRLARFGFDLIKNLIEEYSDGKIIIMNHMDDLEPEEELMSDMLEIMNVLVAKRNGLRKYKDNKKSTKSIKK